METKFSTSQAAGMVGVHRDTLLRWLRAKLVVEPTRDRNGWRQFTQMEVHKIIEFSSQAIKPEPNDSAPLVYAENLARLKEIDWDFSDAKTSYLTHGIHPYPAKFIPQIANTLIQELSSVGDTVVDIFCGSGTTLLEAALLKRHAIGIDANPLAALISRTKSSPVDHSGLNELACLIEKIQELAGHVANGDGDMFYSGKPFVSDGPKPDGQMLEFWFLPHVVEELAEINKLANEIRSRTARDIALCSFSAIIVSVSKQDSDTRYVRRIKSINVGDTFLKYAAQLQASIRSVKELSQLIEPSLSKTVLAKNILASPEVEGFDLVVCSPPYPNAYSYHLYHRTRMAWLGFDADTFKKEEIGSHRKYSLKGPKRATIQTFENEFSKIFEWIRPRLKPKRYACFVVGDSTIDGEQVDNASLLSKVAVRRGFREVERLERVIKSSKKYFNPSIGKIKKEQILILQGE